MFLEGFITEHDRRALVVSNFLEFGFMCCRLFRDR